MTRAAGSQAPKRPRLPGRWLLRDAKARFSELVRRARKEGPQMVTERGRDVVVIFAAEEYRKLTAGRTGETLEEAMRASPHSDIEIEPRRERLPVRDMEL